MSGVLTAAELAASLRVLRALQRPVCAWVVLAWSEPDQRAYASLLCAGYVETRSAPAPRKATAPFRWDRIAATAAGLEYLRQIAAGPNI